MESLERSAAAAEAGKRRRALRCAGRSADGFVCRYPAWDPHADNRAHQPSEAQRAVCCTVLLGSARAGGALVVLQL